MNQIVNINQGRSSLSYALAYAERGWHVFPVWGAKDGVCGCGNASCQAPAKHPVAHLVRRGMSDATTDQNTIKKWWKTMPEAGIGVNLAPSGLVAVDVDPRNGGYLTLEVLEAQHGQIETDLLQFTQGGGEHRFFYLEANSSLQLPGKLGEGVDLKRNGYSVLPPTAGLQGIYEWEASSSPLDGALPAPLPDWIRSLGAPVERPAFSGSTASLYVVEEQIAELRDAMTHVASDDRDIWINFGMALKQLGQAGWDLWDEWSRKSDKYDPMDQVRTWRSFDPRGDIQYPTIFKKAMEADWKNPRSQDKSPGTPFDDETKQRDLARANRMPTVTEREPRRAVHCPVQPIEQMIRHLCDATGAAYGVVPQMAALSIAGLACSRLYRTPQGDGLNLHHLVSAQSYSEAGALFDQACKVLDESGLRRMVHDQRISSSSALLGHLYRTPAMLYVMPDWGRKFYSATHASIEHFGISAGLSFNKTLWRTNAAESQIQKSELDENGEAIIYRPSFNFLAFCPEADLKNCFAETQLGRGLLETFLFTRTTIEYDREPRMVETPDWLREHVRKIRRLPAEGGDYSLELLFGDMSGAEPSMVEVEFVEQPSKRYGGLRELSSESRHKSYIHTAESLLRRVASILAVWAQPDMPVVTPAMLDWADEFVRESLVEILHATQLGGSDDGSKGTPYDAVLARISKAGAAGITNRDLVRSCRPYRNCSKEARESLVSQMLEDEEIVLHPSKARKGAYVLKDLVDVSDNDTQGGEQ